MRQQKEYDRRVTLRLPEALASEIDSYTEIIGMSFTEFLRRACREKLDREKGDAPAVGREEVEKMIREILKETQEGKR